MDADAHPMGEISPAINELRTQGELLSITAYAAPGRNSNKKWGRFFEPHDIAFWPVKRLGQQSDPNDAVIRTHMRCLAATPGFKKLALLTNDSDFLESALEVSAKGIEVVVFMSDIARGTMQKYASAGIRVVPLQRGAGKHSFTVRAWLHPDGTGSVERCAPIMRLPDFQGELLTLLDFLSSLNYRSPEGSRLLPCIAKCWFANKLGPLTVFPNQNAIMALHAAIRLPRNWVYNAHKLAYVLPMSSGKPSKKKQLELGGTAAFRVLQGGGPTMFHDSEQLTATILKKLGYIDDKLNADLPEALLVFINAARNKQLLRQLDLPLRQGQSCSDTCSQLRRAFLSNEGDGNWQIAPSDGRVRQMLLQSNYLQTSSPHPNEVLAAMMRYCRKNKLPKMKTYNGFMWQIMRVLTTEDPSRRDVLGL